MELPPERSNAQASAAQSETDAAGAAVLFEQSVKIMARLRAPDGCPWDREQSFDSIRKYTLEETYEVFDAIERRDWPHLKDELGDLLLQVLFYAEMAANEGHFTIAEVLDNLNRKLVRRHPHVFGDEASRAAGNRAEVDAAVVPRRRCCGIGRRSRRRRHCMQRTRLRRKTSSFSAGWGAAGDAGAGRGCQVGGQGAEGRVRLAELARSAAETGRGDGGAGG